MKAEYMDLRSCTIYADEEEELRRFVRQLLANVVMATDIWDKELGALPAESSLGQGIFSETPRVDHSNPQLAITESKEGDHCKRSTMQTLASVYTGNGTIGSSMRCTTEPARPVEQKQTRAKNGMRKKSGVL